MQKTDNLPVINISPWEGNNFTKNAILVFAISLLITLLSGGVVKIIFVLLSLLASVFIFSNLYGRFSANWRKLHYPLMCRYASAVGYVRGLSGNKEGKELDVDLVLQCLLQSVFPTVEGKRITNLAQEVLLKEGEKLKNEEFVKKIFSRKLPELSKQRLPSLTHKITELNKNPTDRATANYIKIRLIIAFLIEQKYGQEEKLDYLYAVLTNRAR